FFYQAEAGIRLGHVTGLPTCALLFSMPISCSPTPRGARPGVGEHEIGIGPAAHQPQQRFHVRRLHSRVFAHELLEFGKLHLYRGGQAQTLDQQLVSELGEPIFDGSIEILDRLEDGERDDAVHHGARNLPRGALLRNSLCFTSLLLRAMTNAPPDLKRESFEREALAHLDVLYRVALR